MRLQWGFETIQTVEKLQKMIIEEGTTPWTTFDQERVDDDVSGRGADQLRTNIESQSKTHLTA